jgi:O-methyltransferase
MSTLRRRAALFKSKLEDLAQDATAPLALGLPVERWPRWLGDLHQIKVPANVQPNPTPAPVGSANIRILFRLLQGSLQAQGDVAECGVFRGKTLISAGLFLAEHAPEKHLFGFDSFEGFDDAVNKDIELGGEPDPGKKVGGFGETSYETLEARRRRLHLDKLHLVKGFFRDTLQTVADRKFCFAHLDCDLYDSYAECLAFFYPRLSPGAAVLFDEYNDPRWPGCNRAVDEFLADKPETLVEIEVDNQKKWYFRKV